MTKDSATLLSNDSRQFILLDSSHRQPVDMFLFNQPDGCNRYGQKYRRGNQVTLIPIP